METALFSIDCIYYEAYLKNKKRCEVRNRKVNIEKGSTIYFYIKKPIGAIRIMCNVSEVVHGDPEEMWKTYGSDIYISNEEYKKYTEYRKTITILKISDIVECNIEMGCIKPPQFYKKITEVCEI